MTSALRPNPAGEAVTAALAARRALDEFELAGITGLRLSELRPVLADLAAAGTVRLATSDRRYRLTDRPGPGHPLAQAMSFAVVAALVFAVAVALADGPEALSWIADAVALAALVAWATATSRPAPDEAAAEDADMPEDEPAQDDDGPGGDSAKAG